MSRDPQTPSGGSRQSEPPRNLDEALAALQAERDELRCLVAGAERALRDVIDDRDTAERRLDVSVKALRVVRAYHSVPEGAAPCRFVEMLAVVDDAIEARPERGAEGEAPSTEERLQARIRQLLEPISRAQGLAESLQDVSKYATREDGIEEVAGEIVTLLASARAALYPDPPERG